MGQTLTGGNPAKANPKLTAYRMELAQVEAEIEKLINTLAGANTVLMFYANGKIEELDTKRQSLLKAIADMTAEVVSPEQIERISGYLQRNILVLHYGIRRSRIFFRNRKSDAFAKRIGSS